MASCLISLGSNLGNRHRLLDGALRSLRVLPQTENLVCSQWHTHAAVGGPSGQDKFLNGVLRLETSLPPETVLTSLQKIENSLGRQRQERWGPRSIDLDLLLYDQRIVRSTILTLPHPRMSFRRFVLGPASEVAADMVHPTTGWTIATLLEHLNTTPNYVAIIGPMAACKAWLAENLHARFGGRLLCGPEAPHFENLSPTYPPGFDYPTEIKSLRCQAQQLDQNRLLDSTRHGTHESNFLVSDYWLGQSLIHAQHQLGKKAFARFQQDYRSAEENVVQPRLLIVLAERIDFSEQSTGGSESMVSTSLPLEDYDRWRIGLMKHLDAATRRPTLWISARTTNDVLVEAIAAVEAMQ